MKITLKDEASSGILKIPSGDYLVALASDCAHLNLSGGGKTYSVPAIRRKSKTKAKSIQVTFFCGGGSTWSLILCAPRQGEFIAFIELGA